MKVLEIASGNFFSSYGGGQVYVKNIVDELGRLGTHLAVISFVEGQQETSFRSFQKVDLYEVSQDISVASLSALVQKIAPDVIHAHSRKACMCEIARLLNIPVVVTAHHGGILCPAGSLLDANDRICSTTISVSNCIECCLRNIRSGIYWYPLMKMLPQRTYVQLGRWLSNKPFVPFISPIGGVAWSILRKQQEWQTICEKSDVMIAPSHAIAEAMQRNGLPAEKIRVVPHGIPLPSHVAALPSVREGIKFFYVGRICYVKGIHVLLEAFSRLKAFDAELHLIGTSGNKQEKKYMNNLMHRFQSDKRIVWHGKVSPDQVFETIQPFHILVHPTICLEIYGLNIAEALSMGKPVLATRCGGAEMQIEESVNGWLVAPNDVNALAARMNDLCSNHNLIPSLSGVGKNIVSIEEHCKSLVSVYEEITH